ncbi:MAG: hypothetical protein IJW54_00095 [Clostridia bacterium]|nr:hypothetical protein [Clostridia bacterium]
MLDANGATITDETHIGRINPIRYRSYYYDTETKLYYLNARYYDRSLTKTEPVWFEMANSLSYCVKKVCQFFNCLHFLCLICQPICSFKTACIFELINC